MANKRIKRVIIAGAGFSAPAKLPIQSRIIDRMAEVPEMDFLTGKMPEESMTFLDAFITVGLFLLDNYAKKDYTEYRVKYQKLVDKDLAYRTFFGAQEIDFNSLWSEETSKTLSSIFSDEAAHSKHVSNYYSEVYSIRENIRKAIQDEKINVNLEDVFTAFDKSIIAREHLHGYTYAKHCKLINWSKQNSILICILFDISGKQFSFMSRCINALEQIVQIGNVSFGIK